jgi:hypothetical protein
MTTPSRRVGAPKLCPRCGAFYQDLASATCPQCFARLEPLDPESAKALIAEQESRSTDPEYIAAKSVEDERYNEQSFAACSGIVLTVLATFVISIAIIVVAVHRDRHHTPSAISATSAIRIDDALPANLAGQTRTEADDTLVLPGGANRVYHGEYGASVQLFVLESADMTDIRSSELVFAAQAAAAQHDAHWTTEQIQIGATVYVVIAASQSAAREAVDALKELSGQT